MYLEIDEGYFGHRKTLRLCGLLQQPEADVYPPRLWAWAVRSAPTGDLSGMSAYELETALRYPKLDGALYDALVKSAFLDADGTGTVRIHGWDEHTGGAIKRMADEAERKKGWRTHRLGRCDRSQCEYCQRRGQSASVDEDSPRPLTRTETGKQTTEARTETGTSTGRGRDRPMPATSQTSPVKTSPVQSRPDQSRDPDPDPDPEGDPDPERLPPSPRPQRASPQPNGNGHFVEPDNPHNLLCVMQAIANRRRPELGLWSPGKFADRDAADFFRHVPSAQLPAVVPMIRRRIERFFEEIDHDGWPFENFVRRFNALDGPARAPSAPPRGFDPRAQVR